MGFFWRCNFCKKKNWVIISGVGSWLIFSNDCFVSWVRYFKSSKFNPYIFT